MITLEQFEKIINTKSKQWYQIMEKMLPKYKIKTANQVAAFIAQCDHESIGFTHMIENLNYNAQALYDLFRSHFPTMEIASEYERQPEKIANRLYANRMGNGDEHSGDGWKYRGHGIIQITGKTNMLAFGKYIDMSLDDVLTYIATPEGALESACWFWTVNNLNKYADKKDIKGMTKIINGGTLGLADRCAKFEANLIIISE